MTRKLGGGGPFAPLKQAQAALNGKTSKMYIYMGTPSHPLPCPPPLRCRHGVPSRRLGGHIGLTHARTAWQGKPRQLDPRKSFRPLPPALDAVGFADTPPHGVSSAEKNSKGKRSKRTTEPHRKSHTEENLRTSKQQTKHHPSSKAPPWRELDGGGGGQNSAQK